MNYNKEMLTAVEVILTGCQNTVSITFWFLHDTVHLIIDSTYQNISSDH